MSGLVETINAEGILAGSDWHGRSDYLASGLAQAKQGNLALLYNGDWVNDYALAEKAKELSIASPAQLEAKGLREYLGEQGLRTLQYASLAASRGEGALRALPIGERLEAAKLVKYSQTPMFKKQLELAEQKIQKNYGTRIDNARIEWSALYDVFMNLEAKRFADECNKHSDVKVLFNLGNHEPVYFVDMVRSHLDNKEQIINLGEVSRVDVAQSNGQVNRVAGVTNCVAIMKYLNLFCQPEAISQIYAHQAQIQSMPLLSGKATLDDVVRSEYAKDSDYQRIHAAEGSIDVLATHGQIGKVVGVENAYDMPYTAGAAKLSLEATLTIEGHIHNKYVGKNSFGKDMIRVAGEESAIVSKKADGSISTKWTAVGSAYRGGESHAIPYDAAMLRSMIESYKEQIKAQQEAIKSGSARAA